MSGVLTIDYTALAREIVRQQAAIAAPVLPKDLAQAKVGKSGSAFKAWIRKYYSAPIPTDGRYVSRYIEMGLNKEAADRAARRKARKGAGA